jgi:hypothetical protein
MNRNFLYIFLITILPGFSWAIDGSIYFSIKDNHLKVEYEFTEPIKHFNFLPLPTQSRKDIFKSLDSKNDIVLVNGNRLTLETFDLEELSLASSKGNIFFHSTKNLLLYSLLFEGYKVSTLMDEDQYLENLSYYYNGTLLHKRNVYQSYSWERYLLIENSPALHTPFGDIYIDPDLPTIDNHSLKISSVLKLLTEKLGPPKFRPIIFFSYFEKKDEDWWADGRVVMGSPYVQISLGGRLDPEDIKGKVILYHSIYSHEVAHHWNARNLDSDAGAWIHEGGAEAIASLVTKTIFSSEMGEFAEYMSMNNEKKCKEPDEDFDFAYHCGGYIFSKVLNSSNVDPFLVLREIINLPIQSEKAVLEVFSKYTSSTVMNEIIEILKKYESDGKN